VDDIDKPQLESSTPSFSDYDPETIAWQAQLIDDVFHNWDYSLGMHEALLSGSVGSGKSLPAAHIVCRHLLTYRGARAVIGRRAMPDLRETFYRKLVEHMMGARRTDGSPFKEGTDWGYTESTCSMWFKNKSEVIARSWAKGNPQSLGSFEASIAVVEEATENGPRDYAAIKYLRTRVGRLPHVPQAFVLYMANPEAPSHFLYDDFQIGARQARAKSADLNPTRHVYFSRTEDNPFLPAWYIGQLKRDMDPKLARRLLYGEWVEIAGEVIYRSYTEAGNFRPESYTVQEHLPIYISWDFNVGEGKPLSLCLSQYHGGAFHFFAEVVVDGAHTDDALEELAARGLLKYETHYIIHGDATGAARSTQSKHSNYDLIRDFFNRYRPPHGGRFDFTVDVGKSNPPVRTRHNVVNAYCRNEAGQRRFFVYRDCPTLNKGMKLTKLKKGGQYIEDDGPGCPYQHITTAAGYHVMRVHRSQAAPSRIYERQIR